MKIEPFLFADEKYITLPIYCITDFFFNLNLVLVGLSVFYSTKLNIVQCITFLFQIAAHVLWFGYNIKEAIDARRLHHQLIPQQAYYEPDFPQVKNKPSINTMNNRSCVQDSVFPSKYFLQLETLEHYGVGTRLPQQNRVVNYSKS